MALSPTAIKDVCVFFSLSETKVAIFLSRDMAGACKGPGEPGAFRNPLIMLPPATHHQEEVCPPAFCPQLAPNLFGDTVQPSLMHTQIRTRVHTLTHKPTSCRATGGGRTLPLCHRICKHPLQTMAKTSSSLG